MVSDRERERVRDVKRARFDDFLGVLDGGGDCLRSFSCSPCSCSSRSSCTFLSTACVKQRVWTREKAEIALDRWWVTVLDDVVNTQPVNGVVGIGEVSWCRVVGG
jgi:hypothetical protein